jgi:hypothetical protein
VTRSRQECPRCKKWLKTQQSVSEDKTFVWYVCDCGYHSDTRRQVYSMLVASDAAFLRRLLKAARGAIEWEENGDEAWRRFHMTELKRMVYNLPPHLSKKVWGQAD